MVPVLSLLVPIVVAAGPVVTTIKTMIDGLVYGLLTAGVFGWLWPS